MDDEKPDRHSSGGRVCMACGGMVGEDGFAEDLDDDSLGSDEPDESEKPKRTSRGMGGSFADAVLRGSLR